MNTILVGYDLNSPGQNYDELIEKLKSYTNWWHHLDSTWLLKTSDSAVQVRNSLKPFLDKGDELLVIDVTGDAWAMHGFNERGRKWINENL